VARPPTDVTAACDDCPSSTPIVHWTWTSFTGHRRLSNDCPSSTRGDPPWLHVHCASERCLPRSAATLTHSSSARRSTSHCPGAERGELDGRRRTSRAPTVAHPPEASITMGVMSRNALSAMVRRSRAAAMTSGSGIITGRGHDAGFAPCIQRCDHEPWRRGAPVAAVSGGDGLRWRRSPAGLRATRPPPR